MLSLGDRGSPAEDQGAAGVDDGIELKPDEFTERLVAADPASTAEIEGSGGLVVLDTTVTEELRAEGWAADVVRGLQDARKAAGFAVSDWITVTLSVPEDKREWATRHQGSMAADVLATEFNVTGGEVLEVEILSGVTARIARV